MTTLTFSGFGVARDSNDDPFEVFEIDLSVIFADASNNFQYTVETPAGGDELLDDVNLVEDPISAVLDGRTVVGDGNFELSIGNIVTSQGTHFLFALYDEDTNTDYIFQMGGAALTFPDSVATFQELEDNIIGGGSITTGPFRPGVIIDASEFLNTTVSEDDLFAGEEDNDDFFDGGLGDDSIRGNDGNDTLLGGDGSDEIVGGDGDDSVNPGDNSDFDYVEGGTGNDTINFGDMETGYGELSYQWVDVGIFAQLNLDTGNGTVNKGQFDVDTLIGFDVPTDEVAGGDGIVFVGSEFDDIINITVADGHWMQVRGGRGNDTINILGEGSGIRIDYRSGTGVVADLAAGTVQQNGFTDTITGQIWEIRGSDFADNMVGSSNDESFIGRAGNDTIDGGGGFDRMRYDRSGMDSAVVVDLDAGTATGTFDGIAFTHTLSNIEWVRGTREGSDQITGSGANELFDGRGGDDTLNGGGGNDTLRGGDGADELNGGAGLDTADYSKAGDKVRIDLLNAGAARGDAVGDTFTDIEAYQLTDFDDVMNGDNGQMFAYGGAGDDKLTGRGGRDRLFGDEGDDELNGGKGRDRLEGGADNDLMLGLGGFDNMRGGKGDDTLDAGDANDLMLGGRDDDVLIGGAGNDTMSGNTQSDIFVFADGHGSDLITDFDTLDMDEKLDFSGLSTINSLADFQAAATQVGSDVLVLTGGSNQITLENVFLGDFDQSDFIFALG